MGFISDDPTDPFLQLLTPPLGETPAQTTARQERERIAQRISDEIDEEIKKSKAQAKKESAIVRILLLGQAESGKSTCLKNFRMRYDPSAWEKERNGWAAVVQFNIIRSIVTILSVIEAELSGETSSSEESSNEPIQFTDLHQLLLIRLAPLRVLESNLKRWLGAGAEPSPASLPMAATPFESPIHTTAQPSREFTVRCWQDVVDPDARQPGHSDPDFESTTIVLASCRDDMKSLWNDRLVQRALARRKLKLPESAGFFLNELDRIATREYVASDDDIVRARLRTVGIQEYKMRCLDIPEHVATIDGAWEWRIYDVGGCRTARHAWLPYFEQHLNAIIFLCPISCFDERLEEDRRVNRLEDSTILWRSICSSKLLARTTLICFLNKSDVCKIKLQNGVQIKHYLPSYADRSNDVMEFVRYLRQKYKLILKESSPVPRVTYIYPTTVTDLKATLKTVESVRDSICRENLVKAQLM